MAEFKGSIPRYFEATNVKKGNRPEHVMVAGGRDGPEIANIPPKDPSFWRDGESERWTKELQAGQTLPTARTQSPFLVEVRPWQRSWERGVMSVEDMLSAWNVGKKSEFLGAAKPEVELVLFQQDDDGSAAFASIRSLLVKAPVFVGTAAMSDAARGAPLTADKPTAQVFQQMMQAIVEASKIGLVPIVTYLGPGREMRTVRVTNPRLEGSDTIAGTADGKPISIRRDQILSLSLFEMDNPTVVRSAIWRTLTGAVIQPLNVKSGLAEGSVLALPFSLIARTKIIYPQDKRKPARLSSSYSGDPSKSLLAVEQAREYLDKIRRDAVVTLAKRMRKLGASLDVVIPLGETRYRVRLNKNQQLVWTSAGEVNPLALLTGDPAFKGDIVVTPEDYLRVVGLPPIPRKQRKRKPQMRQNPIVYYRSQSDLDNLRAVMGEREFARLQDKGGIQHVSMRPRRKAEKKEVGYIPAGRRAASTGAGLVIRRRNGRLSPAEIHDLARQVHDLRMSGMDHKDVRDRLGISYPQYMLVLREASRARKQTGLEGLSQVPRSNPRHFRGVKQAMTPRERKEANLYARAEKAAGHIPLETLLTGHGEEGERFLPELADVQAHRAEMRAWREQSKREGTYKKLRKFDVAKEEAYLKSLREHAPTFYHEGARGVDEYRKRYNEQEAANAWKKGLGAKNKAFLKARMNPDDATSDDDDYLETEHPTFRPGTEVEFVKDTWQYDVLGPRFVRPLHVVSTGKMKSGDVWYEVALVRDSSDRSEYVTLDSISADWKRRPARRVRRANF